jgi:hypothetical protein
MSTLLEYGDMWILLAHCNAEVCSPGQGLHTTQCSLRQIKSSWRAPTREMCMCLADITAYPLLAGRELPALVDLG